MKKEVVPQVDSIRGRNSGKCPKASGFRYFRIRLKVIFSTVWRTGAYRGGVPRWTVPLFCLMILCSCGTQIPYINEDDASDERVILNNPPKSIAILPFGNKTEVEDIDDFVRTTFYSHLTPHPYRDIELHEVDNRLKRYNLLNYDKLCKVSVKRLGRILRCDAVLIGEVTEFQRVYAGIYSQMAIGASVSIWDTRTGKKLWSDEHITRHHEGGIPLAITDLAMISIRSGLNLTDAEKVKTVDELSRHLVSRVPLPDPCANGTSTKFVSLKRLTKKKKSMAAEPPTTKFRSLKKITKGSPQPYR